MYFVNKITIGLLHETSRHTYGYSKKLTFYHTEVDSAGSLVLGVVILPNR